jgi:hypothetical protein
VVKGRVLCWKLEDEGGGVAKVKVSMQARGWDNHDGHH